jgi:hypothetical protein
MTFQKMHRKEFRLVSIIFKKTLGILRSVLRHSFTIETPFSEGRVPFKIGVDIDGILEVRIACEGLALMIIMA